jgi:hypothetical protein
MSEERKKVLELLAGGKITADEADRLLERLQGRGQGGQGHGMGWGRRHRVRAAVIGLAPGEDAPATADGDEGPRPLPRYLRVLVNGAEGESVNIRVPLKLVRTGIKLGAMLPKDAKMKIEAKGIDLESLSGKGGDELIEALEELQIDVEDGKDTVRIFCE